MAERTDGRPLGVGISSASKLPAPEFLRSSLASQDLNQRLGVRMCGIASVVTYTWLPLALLIYQN
jgi:hypothetical protein